MLRTLFITALRLSHPKNQESALPACHDSAAPTSARRIVTYWLSIVCTLAFSTSAAIAGSVQPVLYVDDAAGRLGTINLSTGEAKVIGHLGVTLFDIAFDADENLYGVNPNGLWLIDRHTAESTFIGGNYPYNAQMNALVFGPNGTLYAAGRDSVLYTVDTGTGFATPVGDMGFASAGDLAFDKRGRLYLSSTNDSLVQIDLATGKGTEIGSFGFSQVLGLARSDDGIMYGYSGQQIFTVDLDTGAGTLLRDYVGSGLSQAYGGSFLGEAIVPEPTGIALALSALSMLLGFAHRRRKAGFAPCNVRYP